MSQNTFIGHRNIYTVKKKYKQTRGSLDEGRMDGKEDKATVEGTRKEQGGNCGGCKQIMDMLIGQCSRADEELR